MFLYVMSLTLIALQLLASQFNWMYAILSHGNKSCGKLVGNGINACSYTHFSNLTFAFHFFFLICWSLFRRLRMLAFILYRCHNALKQFRLLVTLLCSRSDSVVGKGVRILSAPWYACGSIKNFCYIPISTSSN